MSATETRFDTRKFDAFIAQATTVIPAPRTAVLIAETGAILKQCVLWTKTAKPKHIARRSRSEANNRTRSLYYPESPKTVAGGTAWINVREAHKHRVWLRVPGEGPPRFLLYRGDGFAKLKADGRNAVLKENSGLVRKSEVVGYVNSYKSKLRLEAQAQKNAAGLSRQSWIHIAQALGIDLKAVRGGRDATAAIAKAERATPPGGNSYTNGAGMQRFNKSDSYLVLINKLPWNRSPYLRLDVTLQRALNGRAAYFRRNLAAGVFRSLEATARAYPGIAITAPQPLSQ